MIARHAVVCNFHLPPLFTHAPASPPDPTWIRTACRPARGRHFEEYESPDGSRIAFYDDRNVWISDSDRSNERQLAPQGTELLIHRTNRRQNVMELAACDPGDGSCRTVVREEWPASWTDIRPTMRFLEDGRRFIWESERTDWRHYDTIYAERYMYTPQDNAEGYDAGSAMTYADQLEGALLIYYGTADNNVHPNNSMQLIQALQAANKSFEVQVGPDRGHSGINTMRMMEFFIQELVVGAGK